MRRACRSCAGAEVQTVGPSVGQDFVDRVRSTGQLPEMYSDPTRAQVHLLATFFRGHRTYPGTPNGSSGSEARRLGHGLKPPHRDPRTPSTPASCRSNTGDKLQGCNLDGPCQLHLLVRPPRDHFAIRAISASRTSSSAAKLTCCGAGSDSFARICVCRCASAILRAEVSRRSIVSLNDLPPE
jgi:hypothetical protein